MKKDLRKKQCKKESHVVIPTCRTSNKTAFTLAEVLITLGIIGVVAALTMPGLIGKYKEKVLENQFKKAYRNLSNAVKLTQARNAAPYQCFWWETGQKCPTVCSQRNDYGTCIAWTCQDGSAMPLDVNGISNNCIAFYNELFGNTIQIVKSCDRPYEQGCLSQNHKGWDEVQEEISDDPDYKADHNQSYSKSKLTSARAYVASDGMIYFYTVYSEMLINVDINGFKGPNQWGKDIFVFNFRGNETDGITNISGKGGYPLVKGAVRTDVMIKKVCGMK